MQKNYLCKIFLKSVYRMKSLTIRYRISTSDVDMRKNYKAFSFMSAAQDAANMHASAIGFGYDDLIGKGIVWVLSRMNVKFLRAPVWGENVSMSTWHKGRDGVFSLRDFEVNSEDSGEPLVKATSSWLLISTETRRMLRPDHVLGDTGLETALDRDALSEHCGKIVPPAETVHAFTKEAMFSDIDFNMHVNNAKYVEWAFDAIDPAVLAGHELEEYGICFNHEARLGDRIDILRHDEGACFHYIEGRCGDKSMFQTTIRLKP